jgi:glutathione synthase/RimK-type ligase-like ATP-grasp enzyme
MSKSVILLGSKSSGEKNDVAKLKELTLKIVKDINLRIVYFEDLIFEISKGQQSVIDSISKTDISLCDLVLAVNWYRGGKQSIYREVALSLAMYLESKNVEFWNREMLNQRSASKLSAMMQLSLLGLDIPATKFSLSMDLMKSYQDFSGPFIVKAAQASRGRSNHLVKSQEQFIGIASSKATQPNEWLIQEYIPNDYDIRIVCADYKPKLVIKRQRSDESTHLNNISQGASAELIDVNELSPDIIQSCGNICRVMGRNMAGIDLIVSKDLNKRQVFLEVNSVPQLTSGAFISEKTEAIVEALKNTLERKTL